MSSGIPGLSFSRRVSPYALAFFASLCIMVLELVASRLVARHVGSSLAVWTSVIGVILAGICLGNVWGGRLADRRAARRLLGPLLGLGSGATVLTLWANGAVDRIPGLDALDWQWRTVAVVVAVFLAPATILGTIGPVTAKIAVEQARRAGTAMGDIYSLGAIGSIVGTFLAGFVLMYYLPTTTIVSLVAAGIAIPATLGASGAGRWLGLAAIGALTGGAAVSGLELWGRIPAGRVPGVGFGGTTVNAALFAGQALAVLFGLWSLGALIRAPRIEEDAEASALAIASEQEGFAPAAGERVRLGDLYALSFVASFAFMAFEMVAGRLTSRHLGSSIYGWTSVIGVMLAGLSLGNWLGGKIADRTRTDRAASWLLALCSALTLGVLLVESPPSWLYDRLRDAIPSLNWADKPTSLIRSGSDLSRFPGTDWAMGWQYRVLFVVAVAFLLPSIAMGTISPLAAKLAVDRLRSRGRTGSAIGTVYAWGMVGSLVGTFLTGFYLIDYLGTKGVLLILATATAVWATATGSLLQAVWAGIPIGLTLIALLPVDSLRVQAERWGVAERQGFLNAGPAARARAKAAAAAKAEGGAGAEEAVSDEDDNPLAYVDESKYYYIKVNSATLSDGSVFRTLVLDNLIHGYFMLGRPGHLEYDYEYIYALASHRAAAAKARAAGLTTSEGAPDASKAPLNAMFLGGGAYTFPRYLAALYPGTRSDIAEIDPAVTKANEVALGLSAEDQEGIVTHWGDARQFVERNAGSGKYDLIFGDAFNDFSVPWHLTTREFNEKLASMLSENGVYMINIIDVFSSDAIAESRAFKEEFPRRSGREFAAANPEASATDRTLANYVAYRVTDRLEWRARRAAESEVVREASARGEAADPLEVSEAREAAGDSLDRLFAEYKALAAGVSGLDRIDPTMPLGEALAGGAEPGSAEELALDIIDDLPDQYLAEDRFKASRTLALSEVKRLLGRAGYWEGELPALRAKAVAKARRYGGFLASWVETARLTFPHIEVFGTHSRPGVGLRETFVVVASKSPLDLEDLGNEPGDPQFEQSGEPFRPRAYGPRALEELRTRSRGIVLTDDYAPVDNLLAPTAETRAETTDDDY